MLLLQNEDSKTKDELIREKSDLEFQLFRMQDNMKSIAKHWKVLGIEQTKEDHWVVVYRSDKNGVCQIMLHECTAPFRGDWDFAIQASYEDDRTIQIDDIKGQENKGFGTVCMHYLKKTAQQQNINFITGNLVKRDWDHIDRLIHFYRKHNFQVEVNSSEQVGRIKWKPAH
ncbi:hypothetical protein [Alteribacter natronophilus]|uniref:hypothetical protein n=1 Tax=Alteribacter natronophilus TaxID=2583810 RepID=UPI00110EEF7D|nr:hypothetical protein [Alteribacter natronophilus]TMW73459.1 hypothetical protein FGB90_03940 [Alteribacter natronophilus]